MHKSENKMPTMHQIKSEADGLNILLHSRFRVYYLVFINKKPVSSKERLFVKKNIYELELML